MGLVRRWMQLGEQRMKQLEQRMKQRENRGC